ncbi:hypothetical protein ZWY2020_011383 [Hordeum vulgare]|nr:hypothetical protein ZWY2020_018977 [Hordeum vulgare]KAI5009288.1 hypothetical protein ZWY2020_011383 [Hordeum vulgare]
MRKTRTRKTRATKEQEPNLAVADVETAAKTNGEPEPERRVVNGKRMARKRLPMEKVRRVLAIDHKPVVIPSPERDLPPAVLASMKLRQARIAKIHKVQDDVRQDLRIKGYVMGWVTDDDE